jgi:hypothetical protein
MTPRSRAVFLGEKSLPSNAPPGLPPCSVYRCGDRFHNARLRANPESSPVPRAPTGGVAHMCAPATIHLQARAASISAL